MGELSEDKSVKYYTEIGAALGTAIGAALSPLFGDAGIGIPIGLALGLMIGGLAGQSIEKGQLAGASQDLADGEGPRA